MVGWGIPPEAGRNGIIISYIVQLLDTHGAVVRNETVAVQDPTFDSPQSLTHNFTSLKPYTRYLWRVAATTTAGAGPFTSHAHFTTLHSSELLGVWHSATPLFCNCSCSVVHSIYPQILQCCAANPFTKIHTLFTYPCLHPTAPGPVSELRYEEVTGASVNITWKPPKEPNGIIVEYIVEHGVYQDESTTNVTIDARRPTHTVIRTLGKLLLFHMKYQGTSINCSCNYPNRQALVNQAISNIVLICLNVLM